ncbi:MAG: peptide deformylase [Bacteriovoracaceae bacterium]|nr:peptide deformylase [Bacteriovoracaceae bacterium]
MTTNKKSEKKIVTSDAHYPKKASLLDIKIYPAAVLKRVAAPVVNFDSELKTLCQDMLKTMYHAPGIGLAAPQIGISKRIFVLDVDYERKRKNQKNDDEDDRDSDDEVEEAEDQIIEIHGLRPKIYINPEIVSVEGDTSYQEGCLSLPGIFDDVKRHKKIQMKYQDIQGEEHLENADDLLSICMQHETDHLNGVMFIERLSQLKFSFYRNQFIKKKK